MAVVTDVLLWLTFSIGEARKSVVLQSATQTVSSYEYSEVTER